MISAVQDCSTFAPSQGRSENGSAGEPAVPFAKLLGCHTDPAPTQGAKEAVTTPGTLGKGSGQEPTSRAAGSKPPKDKRTAETPPTAATAIMSIPVLPQAGLPVVLAASGSPLADTCDTQSCAKEVALSSSVPREVIACVSTEAGYAPDFSPVTSSTTADEDVNASAPQPHPKPRSSSSGGSEARTEGSDSAESIEPTLRLAVPSTANISTPAASRTAPANNAALASLERPQPPAAGTTIKPLQVTSEGRSLEPAAVRTTEAAVAAMSNDTTVPRPAEAMAASSNAHAAGAVPSVKSSGLRSAPTRHVAGAHSVAPANSTLARSRNNVQLSRGFGAAANVSAMASCSATDTDTDRSPETLGANVSPASATFNSPSSSGKDLGQADVPLTAAQGSHPVPTAVTRGRANDAAAPSTPDTGPDSAPKPLAATVPGVQSARVLERMGQSEMHVGVRTADFGNIEVHTRLNRNHVDAVIATAHAELRSAMQVEAASLQHAMDRHQLQLDHLDVGSHSRGQGGAAQDQDARSLPRPGRSLRDLGPSETVNSPPEAQAWRPNHSAGISVIA